MKLPVSLVEHSRVADGAFVVDQPPEIVGVEPILLHHSIDVAAQLGLTVEDINAASFARAMAGHEPIDGFTPFAMVYAGHQFGHFVPQLGDGRAVMIAEGRDIAGQAFGLQLKGAGKTPYSRFGDGRAVMRSSIREYLCSEHMAALGVPTTRALSLVATREGVRREQLEPGAIVARVAESFIRFGHFEYYHHADQLENVRALADHVLTLHYPDLLDEPSPYGAFFEEVCRRTARLIAQWMAVGFAHGVMNTDNMSILGLTIDYGPFGFLDRYDPSFICNHSDQAGRYAFHQQPSIGLWNLQALAVALSSLLDPKELGQGLATYVPTFEDSLHALMRQKLGLGEYEQGDHELWQDLMRAMQAGQADYTLTFRALSDVVRGDETAFLSLFADHGWDQARAWLTRYRARIAGTHLAEEMDRVNPAIVLRNWVAEAAIRAVEDEGDVQPLNTIFDAITSPYAPGEAAETYRAPPPSHLAGLSVSC